MRERVRDDDDDDGVTYIVPIDVYASRYKTSAHPSTTSP
jgi:hypothetical protein